jgi:hypothetical protein
VTSNAAGFMVGDVACPIPTSFLEPLFGRGINDGAILVAPMTISI